MAFKFLLVSDQWTVPLPTHDREHRRYIITISFIPRKTATLASDELLFARVKYATHDI